MAFNPQPVVWATPPVIGDGSDARGGVPPVFASEPDPIDGVGYNRDDWLVNEAFRSDQGEAKFRITQNHGFFAKVDPILFPGMVGMAHDHEFSGNIGLFEALGEAGVASANFTELRTYLKSTASGGPLNASLYWRPALWLEVAPGIRVRVKAQVTSFYYTTDYDEVPQLQRFPRGFSFIGGVNPADRFNTAFLDSIPDGQGWDKTQRYNGWHGWKFFDLDLQQDIPHAPDCTADPYGDGVSVRQLVNADGSDPWAGAAENPNAVLITTMVGPSYMDGVNASSPTGRGHVAYSIRKTDNTFNNVGPMNWFKTIHPEIKDEYPASRPGLSGHAYRSKLSLSSDYDHMTGELIHPRCSTSHFDFIDAWEWLTRKTWHGMCNGIEIDGVAGQPLTCNNSTISDVRRMLVGEASPDPSLSNSPVIEFKNYRTGPSKAAFGKLDAGTKVSGIVA